MELYIGLFIALVVIGLYTDKEILLYNGLPLLSPRLYLVVASIVLFGLSAFREGIGTDYALYESIYEYREERWLELSFLYSWMSEQFRANRLSYQVFIGAHAFIFVGTMSALIRTHSRYYYLSFVTLLGTYMYFTSFNTFRQMTAAAFVVCALLCLFYFRKVIFALLFFAISLGFHKSSVMYAPLLIFRYMRIPGKVYVVLLIFATIAYFGFPESVKVAAFDFLLHQNEFFMEKYEDSPFVESEARGMANKVFFVFYVVILWRLVLASSYDDAGSWIERVFLLYIFVQAFLPASNVTDRMTIAFELLAVTLIPRFVATFNTDFTRGLVKFFIITVFFVRMAYVLALNGDGVVPYRWIF